MEALSGKEVFVSKDFARRKAATASSSCSYNLQDGLLLYPLNKSFLIMNHPTVIIPFASIDKAVFRNLCATFGTGVFDLCVSRSQ